MSLLWAGPGSSGSATQPLPSQLVERRGTLYRSLMNQENPPPHPGPGPSAPYPPYPQKQMGPGLWEGALPTFSRVPYQGYKDTHSTVGRTDLRSLLKPQYMVEGQRRDELKPSTYLTAYWTASVAAVSGACSPDQPSHPVLPALPHL